MIPLVPS